MSFIKDPGNMKQNRPNSRHRRFPKVTNGVSFLKNGFSNFLEEGWVSILLHFSQIKASRWSQVHSCHSGNGFEPQRDQDGPLMSLILISHFHFD